MRSSGSILLYALLGVLALGLLAWRGLSSRRPEAVPVAISKQPASFTSRTFDPSAPPPDMPALGPGEAALCDSSFLANASIAGETHQDDATHAMLTITRVNVTLQLNTTIWVPAGATQHMIDHEEGHREISEYYYQGADKLAERIAETFVGRQVPIAGADLGAASSQALQKLASDFTDEYDRQLNPGPTQELYDTITDHSRNESVAKDALGIAIKNVQMTAIPGAATGN